jgi:hypothetical protein
MTVSSDSLLARLGFGVVGTSKKPEEGRGVDGDGPTPSLLISLINSLTILNSSSTSPSASCNNPSTRHLRFHPSTSFSIRPTAPRSPPGPQTILISALVLAHSARIELAGESSVNNPLFSLLNISRSVVELVPVSTRLMGGLAANSSGPRSGGREGKGLFRLSRFLSFFKTVGVSPCADEEPIESEVMLRLGAKRDRLRVGEEGMERKDPQVGALVGEP